MRKSEAAGDGSWWLIIRRVPVRTIMRNAAGPTAALDLRTENDIRMSIPHRGTFIPATASRWPVTSLVNKWMNCRTVMLSLLPRTA